MKVFVSYSHRQSDWVLGRLVPCLHAGGAEVLIDVRQFGAGRSVLGQMDATQDQAARHVLVLSADYLASDMCCHEMKRALARDPEFVDGVVVPLRRDDAAVPPAIKPSLYIDLRDDLRAEQWDLLLKACDARLGATAPDWLAARDEAGRFLENNRSVNLVVHGDARWSALISDLCARPVLKLASVDLERGATVPRDGFVAAVLAALGGARNIPPPPRDLAEFDRILTERGLSRVALRHFDMVLFRPDYDMNLFASLRHLVMTERRLVLLVHSRAPVATLLPQGHQLSHIDFATVELRAAP
jgi:hypothetical protein